MNEFQIAGMFLLGLLLLIVIVEVIRDLRVGHDTDAVGAVFAGFIFIVIGRLIVGWM